MNIKDEIAWWRKSIQNGNKVLFAAFVFFITSLIILGASAFIYLSGPSVKPGLCEYPSPRPVLTTLKGIEGKAVEERGQVIERATRCVDGANVLEVLAVRSFRNIETNQIIPDLRGEKQTRAKGRISTDVVIQLPPEVTPGIWRLEGADQVPATGELRTWFSENFVVVAK